MQKWLAIGTLFIGVVLAQWKHGEEKPTDDEDTAGQSYTLGLFVHYVRLSQAAWLGRLWSGQ